MPTVAIRKKTGAKPRDRNGAPQERPDLKRFLALFGSRFSTSWSGRLESLPAMQIVAIELLTQVAQTKIKFSLIYGVR
jgi:hypothetical protein